MIKNRIRQYLPGRQSIEKLRGLRCLGTVLHDPRLWACNRRSITNACALGLFAMWIPIPVQMLFVAAVAIPCRANLPLTLTLVWITNPFTAPPMFYGAYLFGTWALQRERQTVAFDISGEWLAHTLGQIWEPFMLGCLLLGIISAALGYGAVQIGWRLLIHREREKRKLK